MALTDDCFSTEIRVMLQNPPQVILVAGYGGYGSVFESNELARRMAGEDGTVQTVRMLDDKASIGVAQIQELYRKTRSKNVTGRNVWVIEDAESMSTDAQNALLKLLEEPPASAFFILAVKQAENVLATVRSRSQLVICLPYDSIAATQWLQEDCAVTSPDEKQQILFLAGGSIGELLRLGKDVKYRQASLHAAANAKTYVFGTVFEKITFINSVATDRSSALLTLHIGLRMLLALSKKNAEDVRYAQRLELLTATYQQLKHNGNIRIQLLRGCF